jgi:hypothetical protein
MMKLGSQRYHWRALIGALAVAGLGFGLSLRLEGAAHVPGGASARVEQKITASVEDAKREIRAASVTRGAIPGEPVVFGNMADLMSGNVPIFPTIVVDYRDDDATRMREAGLLQGPLPMVSHDGGVALGGCSFDVDCDDGNRCTTDTCDFTPGQPAGSGVCENTVVPNGLDGNVGNAQCPGNFGLACGGCDDGLFCNGVETCNAGVCVAGTPPCTGLEVCSETFDMCQAGACTSPADCSIAGVVGAEFAAEAALLCNGAEACTSGVCIAGTNPCGTGGVCGEKRCSVAGQPLQALATNVFCITNEDCAEFAGSTCTVVGPACRHGRCCSNAVEPVCTRRLKSQGTCGAGSNIGAPCTANNQCGGNNCNFAQSCDTQGGVFYGHDQGSLPSGGGFLCPIVADVQVKCPKYGAGIAPAGPYVQLLGPISDSPVVVSPFGVALQKLGDDYALSNPGVCVGGTRNGLGCNSNPECTGGGTCNLAAPSFIALDYLRFAGGSPVTDRISFEFYDEGNNLVEDLFFSGTAAFGIYNVLFDPPINIPSRGYVVQRVAPGFSPNARHIWASTDATDVGTNDANKLWVNGGPVNSNFGTTGRLAFELEGTKVAGNFGACCYTDPDFCVNSSLPWVCRGTDGEYLGNASLCAFCDSGPNAGQYCRRCSNNTAQVCNRDSDCGAGTCDPFNGACGGGGVCVNEQACNEGACCNPTTGACTIQTQAACGGSGGNYLGNGSDCDSDNGYDDGEQHCCPQPLSSYSGRDDCEDVVLHTITAPPQGETKVITITGNNEGATNSFGDPDSCFAPSDDPNADPGWWEGFTLVDDCTIIYVDHCCTDPVHRPAYRTLYDTCPCGSALFTVPNPYNFPEPADSRGLPYCAEDDNAWQCFGLLTPGTYYYPIYSALAGHHGDYQFHIVAKACPTAACCLEDQCVDEVNQLECDALGGYFLAPPNKSPAVSTCTGTNGQPGSTCFNGSCCTGPGECLDVVLNQQVTKADCDAQLGTFVGGVRCEGGNCSSTPIESCNDNGDCPNNDCLGDEQARAQPSPCPVCEIEGTGNCQAFENVLEFTLSDRHLGNGLLAADDFSPDGANLTQVCVWGFYLDGDPDAAQNDCGPDVTADHFRVRVYNNDPATGRSPGTLFGESMATSDKGIVTPTTVFTLIDSQVYGYQMTLDTPITGLTPGAVYWLEVSNDVSESVATCNWFWMQKTVTENSLSFGGDENGYGPTFEVAAEQAFCTNFTFTASTIGSLNGACCTCDGNCSLRTLSDCANNNGVWDITENSCAGVSCPVGAPANDNCASGPPTIVDGIYTVNNQCATTDGFGPIPSDFGGSQLDFDVWYYYIAPTSCNLVVSECASGLRFDSMLAVYHNPSNPTVCPPCPLDSATSAATLAGIGQDESCTGEAVGGPGIWTSQDQILRNAQAGECFLLRIGSFPGSRGTATLAVSCGTGGDTPAAVVPDGVVKTRFISFNIPVPATAGGAGETAIRIKLTNMHVVVPPYSGGATVAYTAFNGQSVYAGPPQQFVESSSSGTPFYASFAQCAPYYHDWSTIGLLHVTGPAIVPSSTFTVEHLGAACQGAEGSCSAFEPGVEIKTTRWGDVTDPYNPPSATVQPDVADIGALVNKFRSAPGAPIKARSEIAGAPGNPWGEITAAVLNVDLGFSHISACVDAFRGVPYPYKMGKCDLNTTACTNNSDCGANGPCNLYCP